MSVGDRPGRAVAYADSFEPKALPASTNIHFLRAFAVLLTRSTYHKPMSSVKLTRRSLLGAIAAGSVATLASPAVFAAPTVALTLQGAILAKALNYDQTLGGRSPKVMIIAKSADGNAKRLAAAFTKLGADVRTATPGRFGALEAGWADAAYVFTGQLTSKVRELCKKHRVLSMSEWTADVERGQASAAVGVNKGKPQLVINVTRVGAEGHRFSSRLLKLARVIR